MLRNTLLASVLAFGIAVPALAESGPRLVGGGDNATVSYGDGPMGSLVGGGQVTLNGGGEDRSYTYGALNAQAGRDARLVGGGEDAQVVYGPAQPASGIADRAAAGYRG